MSLHIFLLYVHTGPGVAVLGQQESDKSMCDATDPADTSTTAAQPIDGQVTIATMVTLHTVSRAKQTYTQQLIKPLTPRP